MKITIEHLAPYLPYQLRIKEGNNTYVLQGGTLDGIENYPSLYSGLKPLLRPLTDLHQLIPNKDYSYSEYISTSINDNQRNFRYLISGKYDQLEYWKLQRLFQYHFDVFGLIEQGLAIDINTQPTTNK